MNDELKSFEIVKRERFNIENLMERFDDLWNEDDDAPVFTNRFVK